MSVIIKKTGQVTEIERLTAHIKYIGFRSQEIEKDGEIEKIKGGQFFSSYADKANYKSFLNGIKNNKALKHQKSIKAHKFVFSLTDKDYNEYLKSGKDYKDLIRETLKTYEREKGLKLKWIAVNHLVDGKNKTHHPHSHVVIQGVSEPDKDGVVKRIKFYKEDFKKLRETFDKELRKEIGTLNKEFDVKEHYEKSIANDIGKGFEMVTKQIQKDINRNEQEKEASKKREQFQRKKENNKER